MPTSMSVVPGPAGAAFGLTSAVAAATNVHGAGFGADRITVEVAEALGLVSAGDTMATAVAAQIQVSAGQLGASQVQSYVDTDDMNAQSLSGMENC